MSTYSVCSMKMKQLPPHRLHKREGALELYVGSTTSLPMSRGAWGGTLGIPERTLLLGPLNRRAGTTAASALLRYMKVLLCISSVRLLSHVPLFATPWTAACQASLSITKPWKPAHLHPLSLWYYPTISSSVIPILLLSSIFPSIRVFSNESVLHIRWPKYSNFSIDPSNEHSGLMSFRTNWFNLLQSKGLLRAFSNTMVQKHQFLGTHLSLWFNSHIHTWLLEKL